MEAVYQRNRFISRSVGATVVEFSLFKLTLNRGSHPELLLEFEFITNACISASVKESEAKLHGFIISSSKDAGTGACLNNYLHMSLTSDLTRQKAILIVYSYMALNATNLLSAQA